MQVGQLNQLFNKQAFALSGFHGFVVAADALGQMVFSPLFGLLADKLGKVRPVNLLCAGTFIAGNAMFSLISLVPRDAWDLDQPRTWSLFVVRFIVGIGTGTHFLSLVAFNHAFGKSGFNLT